MSLAHSSSIVTDALILALDAANAKSHNSSENLLTNSQSFNNWSGLNSTVTADQAYAPDGTFTADLVSNTQFLGSYIALVTALSQSTTYTFSLYVKPITANKIIAVEFDLTGSASYVVPIFDLSTLTSSGGGSNKTITDVGNGWYRVSVNITTLTGIGPRFNVIYIGAYGSTGNSVSMYFWGAQITKSSGAVPYVATTTTAISRSTAWSDQSGNGNNGTIINGSSYSPSNRGSVFFDGSLGQHVNIRSNARILSNLTYTKQVWINSNNTSQSNNIISSNNGEHFLYLNAVARPWAGHPPEYSSITSSTTLLANTWYNVAVTFDASIGWRMYINGVLNASTANLTAFSQFSDVSVGAFFAGSSFYGNMNNVLVYNRVLTASEVLQNFNAQRGRYEL